MEKEKDKGEEIQENNQDEGNKGENAISLAVDEIEQIDSAFGEEIQYEEIAGVESSPMNEAVKQGEVSEGTLALKPPEPELNASTEEESNLPPELLAEFEKDNAPPEDAPEQEIDATEEEELEGQESGASQTTQTAIEPRFENSEADHHAGIAADSLIGVADNLLETGGGFLVKLKKKSHYHDFDKWLGFEKGNPNSLNTRIDDFNEKSIKRIKLDEEDKKQLKPVLKEVLKRKSKALTPEQQLMALGITILMKKGKAVIEMRNESRALQAHFDGVIKEHFQKEKEKETPVKVVAVDKFVELKVEEDGEKGEDNTAKQAA